MRTGGFTLAQLLLTSGALTGGLLAGMELWPSPAGAGIGVLGMFAMLFVFARLSYALDRVPPCRCGAEYDSAYEPAVRPRWDVVARCRSCGLCYVRRGSRWIEIMPDNRGQVVLQQDFWLRWRPVGSTAVVNPDE